MTTATDRTARAVEALQRSHATGSPPGAARQIASGAHHGSRVLCGVVVLALVVVAMRATSASAAAPVSLGSARSFAVLAGSTITNTGPTTITGDVGLHPGSAVTGFNAVTLNGELHVADAVAAQAKVDLVNAFQAAAGRGPATRVATELGGSTLMPGVYDSASGTFGITGTVTLDAQGDPDAVFVFQMASTLVTASNSHVVIKNAGDACNVFWQVGSSATLGTGTAFRGNILARASITLNTGATVRKGRLLARNGAVTLDTNTITRATCRVVPAATPTPPPTAAPTDTPAPTAAPTDTPAPTAAPTATAGPTATPGPTDTPAPTATPRPTAAQATPRPTPGPRLPPTTTLPGSGGDAGGPTDASLLAVLVGLLAGALILGRPIARFTRRR